MNDETIPVIGVIILIVAILFGGGAWSNYRCNQLEDLSGKKTEWRLGAGCYVEVNGRLIPQENWRGEYEQ